MRLVALAGISLSLALTLAGCGSASGVSPVASRQASGIVVEPSSAADLACNAGRGISLEATSAPTDGNGVTATAVMPNGSVVIAYNDRHGIVVESLRGCGLDEAFGNGGVATVTSAHRWMSVAAVTARQGGGVILAGTDRSNPVVGELDRHGQVVRSFGHDGLARFPFCGAPTSVLQEPSGRIVVAGDTGLGVDGCGGSWVAAASASGQFDERFGFHGSAELPTYGADSGIGDMTRLSNGDILVGIGFGNSGCWGYTLRLLTPAGWPVPEFAARFEHFWGKLGYHAFSGAVYADEKGFTLVGTGQKPCWMGGPFSSRSVTGLVVNFRNDGLLARPVTRFASGMHSGVSAFSLGRDIVVATSPYTNGTRLALTAVRTDGSIDSRFGSAGRVLVRVPWKGKDSAWNASVSVVPVGARSIVLLGTNEYRRRIRVMRILPFNRG